MWRASVRDLQFRRRRFLIAVLAAGLVFAMTLLTAGASAGLHDQDRRIIDSFHGDAWFVAAGASGPFTSTTPIPASVSEEVARLAGVTRATPVVIYRSTVESDRQRDANFIGVPPGGLGAPVTVEGRPPRGPGEIVADSALGLRVGSLVKAGGSQALVVGTVKDARFFFGTPTVYLALADIQERFFGFLPLATAVVAQGRPTGAVAGIRQLTVTQVRKDLARPTKRSDQTIKFINVLLWFTAVGVIGSIVYLSALERVRDFAVMKATGATTGSLLVGLTIQAAVLSLASAAVGALLAQVLAPGFPFTVKITAPTYLTLVAVALGIGFLASGAGLRRVAGADPALAFGGA